MPKNKDYAVILRTSSKKYFASLLFILRMKEVAWGWSGFRLYLAVCTPNPLSNLSGGP